MWKQTAAKYLSYTLQIKKQHIISKMEYRWSFFVEVGGMFFNNATLILLWYIYFQRFPSINGWGFVDSLIMLSVIALINSFIYFFALGALEMSSHIYEGRLDNYLLYPKNVLWQIVISASDISAIGDFLFGLSLFLLLPDIGIWQILVFLAVSILGAIIAAAFSIIFNTITFFAGNFENPAWAILDGLMTVGNYPGTIYRGAMKIVSMTILPAFFMVTLPISLIKSFDVLDFVYLLLFTAGFAAFAVWFFYFGLKRYESGNLINLVK